MGQRASAGLPAKITEDNRETRIALAGATKHRVVAILNQAFDLIDKRDPAAALARKYEEDPLSYLERVHKLLGPEPGEGKTSNINGLFVLAARQAAQAPAVLDAEVVVEEPARLQVNDAAPIQVNDAKPARVQSGSSPDQPVDW
jgi:hypothetical protein